MTRRFESDYRLHESDDVLAKLNKILKDLDLRADAIELIAAAFRDGNRLDVDALVKSINDDFAVKSAAFQEVLDELETGFTPERIIETAEKRFTSDAEISGLEQADAALATALSSGLGTKVNTSTFTSHTGNTNNPHGVTKEQVGLGNVEDIAPDEMPVSAAQAIKIDNEATARANADALRSRGLFIKSDAMSVAFSKTGSSTVSVKSGTVIEVNGSVFEFAAETAVTMPALTAGTDYAIWIEPTGTLTATTSFVSPPIANSRLIGGFHYAPGGNATGASGGDTTPTINQYSLWDLKFRPECTDPRGMALIAGAFWCDIYLLGIDHLVNGTSKYNVTIADGLSPPKRPTMFGGDGTAAYSSLTWWEASEVMLSHGKQLPSYSDFAALAYGTTENSWGGAAPVSTILRNPYTSKFGIMLVTGNIWVWGNNFGGPYVGSEWSNMNGGRGQVYNQPNVLVLGGSWGDGAYSGSRASAWNNLPSASYNNIGARGRCGHLILV